MNDDKTLTFFKVELYLDENKEIHASFDYDGEALRGIVDEDLAYECFERAMRTRALMDAAFTDPEELLAKAEITSPEFKMEEGL